MARRRRGGFGGVLVLLVGASLIGMFAGGKDDQPRVEPTPSATTTTEMGTPSAAGSGDIQKQEQVARPAPEPVKEDAAPRWIRGSKVAFRAGPATTFTILDRFSTGRQVALLRVDGDWSQVRDELTRREGWVASRFLADQEPPARKPKIEKRKPAEQPVVVPRVEVSDAEIIDRIIAQSIASYSGNCPCPFNTDRAGRRCGKRSAYSRPGGASPICFVGDVTPDMIAAFRRR